ncbi:hypothetical protein BGZ70_006391, partial [Mortierella alpina]
HVGPTLHAAVESSAIEKKSRGPSNSKDAQDTTEDRRSRKDDFEKEPYFISAAFLQAVRIPFRVVKAPWQVADFTII